MNHEPSAQNRQMFQPATAFWRHYHPETAPYAFHANSAEQARSWQEKTRLALGTRLGFVNDPPVEAGAEELMTADKGDYLRTRMVMQTAPDTAMPFYLLTPKECEPPYPVVLALAGHGYGVSDIVGLWEDGSERDTPDGYHRDFAVALCRQGFAVVAPEISCFGDRRTDFGYLDQTMGQQAPTTCEHTAALALHHGGSVVGLRVRDGLRLVDYLQTRADLDIGRLGCMGISGGGMHTLFSTCMDTRITAAVVSGYFSTFRDSILAMHHCPCNFVHGLSAFGEMADLAGLVAPRPLFVESGNHDPIFPREAVEHGLVDARKVYSVFGAQERLEHGFFEGRHRIDGTAAYQFLRAHLA
ncbi:MAG: acetylxylan esterase [Spirochaetales bacterium]|nr:MAG: acetylxylan esterase [Spirochaetales bacterium]